MKKNKVVIWIMNQQDYLLILLATLFSIPLILPYFHSGYFPTHDGEWAVVRLADMFRLIRDFQIPARYSGSLNFGYGYPLFNFDYPFPYYFALLFHFLRINFVDSIKILFAISVPISAIGMYLLSKKVWGSSIGAFASSLLYIYIPYRIVDLYVRGSIGESVAFAIAPFLFLSLYNVFVGKKENVWIVITAFLYAMLITSHNIMSLLFSIPLFVFFVFLCLQNKKRIIVLVASIFSGVLLSSFFIIPALLEKHYILLSKIPIADRAIYFVTIPQLLFSSWGYGVPADPNGSFTYQLGLPQIVVFFLAIIFIIDRYIRGDKKENFKTYLAGIITLTTFALSFLLFSPSNFIWEHTPLLSEINYPWILIGILGFLISFLAGYVFSSRIGQYLSIFIVLGAIVLVLPNAHPQSFVARGDDFYITNEATTTSSQEVMPLWVKKMPTERFTDKVKTLKGSGEILDISYNSKQISFKYDSDSPAIVEISTIYYPGWRAYSNGSQKAIFYDNDRGLMNLKLTSGKQNIKLIFGETPLRLLADGVTIITLIFLIIFLFVGQKFIKTND